MSSISSYNTELMHDIKSRGWKPTKNERDAIDRILASIPDDLVFSEMMIMFDRSKTLGEWIERYDGRMGFFNEY